MEKINFAPIWKMRIVGEEAEYPATVPGSVYNDLLAAGRIEDPYYRDNEMPALDLMKNCFEYRAKFDIDSKELLDVDEVILRFNGLDTLADIYLNGTMLGSVNNMHRTWDYRVFKLLKLKENELVVVFYSPTSFIAEEFKKDPAILGTEDAMNGFPKIRKGHYMFGWDWGPRLPDAGIWRPVELLKLKKARLTSTYINQAFNKDMSEVKISVKAKIVEMASCLEQSDVSDCDNASGSVNIAKSYQCLEKNEKVLSKNNGYVLKVTLTAPDGTILFDKANGFETLTINNPKLWWPNGLGEQPLYTVKIELFDVFDDTFNTNGTGDKTGQIIDCSHPIDSVEKRIGLRKLEVSTAKDEYGSEFAQVINDIKFFAMGADYIPEDNILPRCNSERTRKLLSNCVAANFNSIRVWGGGLYPDDYFFDICDELGLVVWQDFMFACANYRLTKEFEDNILSELKGQIRRLAHHASLGLWCGNNEMEMFVGQGTWGAKNEIKSDYVKMYEYLFPRLLEEEDPDRFYWPASPSSGGAFDYPNDPDRGDVHYWEVWHGNKPFTEYRQFYFRYLSEFGFQSFPSMRTIESFTEPEDRNVFSYIMEKHQRNAAANGKIMNYMEQTFLYPNSLDTLVYASQLLQAEAIRYGVEHFRRNRGRCMGTVYWQLNDCWPVASWASIDYYGRWKALHYFAKRFFAPLMLSCEEEGLLTQSLNVNAEPFEVKKSIRLNVTNESKNTENVMVSWQLRDAEGKVIREEKQDVTAAPFSAVWLDKVNLPEAKLYENYVSFQLRAKNSSKVDDLAELGVEAEVGLKEKEAIGEEIISFGTVLFCPPKHFKFKNPKLKVSIDGDRITVSASAYAKSVEIRNENDDLILSDNFFDLNGDSKTVKILQGKAEGITVRSVYDIR